MLARCCSICVFLTCSSWVLGRSSAVNDERGAYLIGTGIYDMTGPAAQINLMGYARTTQTAHGIHQRLRARAYIIAEKQNAVPTTTKTTGRNHLVSRVELEENVLKDSPPSVAHSRLTDTTKIFLRRNKKNAAVHKNEQNNALTEQQQGDALSADPSRTICFVSIDAGMGSDLLTMRVIKRLEEILPEQRQQQQQQQQGGTKRLCHLENLSISGTHTHSAPAGFLQYTLYQITSLGFFQETMDAFVEGVAQALLRAYNNLESGSIHVAQGHLLDANINRSPSSYLLNPEDERLEYSDQGDTDKTVLQLSFVGDNSGPQGILNWFAVHGTSMNSSNLLLSGDNKGYASYLMEKLYNGNGTLPGQGEFVAAFASTNLGDVSPNTAGPRCLDTGLPCDVGKSTCNGKNELCVASGPGKDMFESTEIIGRKQFDMAMKLMMDTKESLNGSISFRHSYIDISQLNVTLESGEIVQTCPAALGYSFAAGTTDGPGDFDFTQGTNTSNPFWNMIGGFLSTPSKAQIACQAPKPILLNTGRATLPYDWDPNTVPISIFRVGQLFVLNVPAEFTTMAGRRLRKKIRIILEKAGIKNPVITIAGLANSYTHYVTTFEEYTAQRYEAASTLYGPHTLSAYIQEFERITADLVEAKASTSEKGPRDLSKWQVSLIPPVVFDTIGAGKKFGSLTVDALDSYKPGSDTVSVTFRSANPRNNQRIEGTFLTVDRLDDDGNWQTVYVDGDWCTKFHWKGGLGYFGVSFAEMQWDIPSDTPRGLYRICHRGTRKTLLGNLEMALYSAPDWFTTNLLGSAAVSLAYQTIKLALMISDRMRQFVGKVTSSRYKEFQGCSKTFLVRQLAE